jgi:arylsulfatase A-like enzyme/Flp pilus assembly protein TadD
MSRHAGALCFALFAFLGCQGESESPAVPLEESVADDALNLVLITLDTTRADALGSYGQRLPTSPNLDRLAEQGTQFFQCVSSAPSTLPSHATLFTGKQPYVHGVRANAGYVLSDANVTLAEILREHGYETAAEVAAPVVGSHTQLDQGFARYRDLKLDDIEHKKIRMRFGEEERELTIDEREANDITKHGIRFIKENRETKFFLWLHYFDAHQPYSPPGRFGEIALESPYHGEVRYTDEQVGRVLKQIEGLGLRERTLVVVTADHGEGLDEHSEITHAYFVYDSTIRVPLLLWGAGVPKGLKISSLVRTVDVAPTILDWLGLPPLDDVQGVSLRPLLEGTSQDLELVGYGESIDSHVTFDTSILRYVREGRWKYIHKVEPELFDLTTDPGEIDNLAAAHPEIVERLRAQLSELIETAPAKPSDAETAIDAETAAQLEALGYMAAAPIEALDDEVALLELEGDDPTSKVPDMAMLAVATGFHRFKRFDEAAKTFRELVERNPESVTLLLKLDDVLKLSGRDDERFELLPRVIALAPEEHDLYMELAHITFKRGDQAGAEKLLTQALEIDPCLASTRATLAHLMAERGDRAGQLRLLKAGVEHCPFSAGLHNSYAYLLATAPDEKHRNGPEALRIAQRVTRETSEPQPSFLDTLASAYAEVGDFANAVSVQKRALRLIEATGDAEQIGDARDHLAELEAGRPVREN